MTDRELLEAAAKAAGIEYDPKHSKPHPISGAFWGLWLVYHDEPTQYARRYFNPLTDDGDAQRLGVKLQINVSYRENLNGKWAVAERNDIMFCPEPFEPDPYAATRRAIVRAAASIGAAIGEKAR